MLSISSGHSVDYLTDGVAQGRENYYTDAVAAGEPPGRWYGAGAQVLGLAGLVDEQDMTALYERFIDPRDPAFKHPSQWTQASTLGHTGRTYKTEDQLYEQALNAEPNASPERRAELHLEAGKKAQKNVTFLDATFSVQKSVTVLHTAYEAQEVKAQRRAADESRSHQERGEAARAATSWAAHRQAVEDAIWAGNHAALDYLADKAGYSRIGHHGGAGGRWIDAHEWVVASFFQHDSRNHDPQLHIHNAILNRVQCADGQWRTLDSKAIHKFRGAAAAVGERTMEEHLTRCLGVAFATRPDGKAREILGIDPEVMDLFSSRRRAITQHTQQLVTAFEATFGREPNSLELDRLQRQATFATRNVKSHDGETLEQRLERWDRQLRAEVAGGLASVAAKTLTGQQQPVSQWSPTAVIETALADLQSRKAAWTVGDLTRAISDALPDHVGNLGGHQVADLLDTLTEAALSAAVPLDAPTPGDQVVSPRFRLANGTSSFTAPGGPRFATAEHVRIERAVIDASATRTAPALSKSAVSGFVTSLAESGIELGVDQAAAVRGVLTSGASVESLVGPAGTGKSFVVGVVARAWQDPDLWEGQARRVFGLAPSQIAADVLTGEGVTATNTAQWLATQQRLTDGTTGGDDEQWRLRAGDLVVVDEYSMADTTALAGIYRHAQQVGVKVLLTGDHRQLTAVGAGGIGQDVAEAGISYELAEARRFHEEWERDASLRLRSRDPGVLGEYHKHGRLVDAGTVGEAEASASRAWLADTVAGRRSLLLVDTNEQAARLSAQLRAELVRLGKVEEQGVPLGRQGTYAGVGDVVQARLNRWDLAGFEGNRRGPINREQYRVIDTRQDGGLVVAPILGRTSEGEELGERMTLPGDYVAGQVDLGYVSTVHAAEGVTVDTSHGVVTPATGAAALYVQLTRGRDRNTAHVATTTTYAVMTPQSTTEGFGGSGLVVPTGRGEDTTDAQDVAHQPPVTILANTLDTAQDQRSATATAAESAVEAGSVRTVGERLAAVAEDVTADRTARLLDELVGQGHLDAFDRIRIAAENGGPTLARVLRRAEVAGLDPRQVLTDAVKDRSLHDARLVTNVIHERIIQAVDLTPRGSSFADWTPSIDNPADQRYVESLAAAADTRARMLGDQVAAQRPQWAVEALGPPPTEDTARSAWVRRAGIVAAHRELTGHDDPATALGAAPKAGQIEAYASWRAAWRELGQPDADTDERAMSTGQLRVRTRAWEREAAWGPRYVANELASAQQAAARHQHTATLRAAEAAAATGAAERERLRREARHADATAAMLEQEIAKLEVVDRARAAWLVQTAGTRAAADRAEAELRSRLVAADRDDEQVVTAEEWLAAHHAAQRFEDQHREITDETDLVEVAEHRARDAASVEASAVVGTAPPVVDSQVTDIREVAATEPPQIGEDIMRLPSADEAATYVSQARRALVEMHNRQAAEEQRALEEARAEQLAGWHAEDLAQDAATRDVEWEPVADHA